MTTGIPIVLFLSAFAATSVAEKVQPNVPWRTTIDAERFLGVFEKAMLESKELQQQGINDLHWVSESVLSLINRTSAKISVARIQALNMAFGSIIASILTAEGSGNLDQKINAVRKALVRAFRETSGSTNIALIQEIISMIKLYSSEPKGSEMDSSLPKPEYPESTLPDSTTGVQTQSSASAENKAREVTSTATSETSAPSSTVSTAKFADSEVSENTSVASAEATEVSSLFENSLVSVLLKNAELSSLISSITVNAPTFAEAIADAIASPDVIYDLTLGISQAAASISAAEKSDTSTLVHKFASSVAEVLSNHNILTTKNAIILASQIENSLSAIILSANTDSKTLGASASTLGTNQITTFGANDSAATSSPSATTVTTTQATVNDESTANSVEPIAPSILVGWNFPWSNEYGFTNTAIGESAATSSSSAATTTRTQTVVSDGSTGHSVEPIVPSEYFDVGWKFPWPNDYDFTNAAIGEPEVTSSSSGATTTATHKALSDGSTAHSVEPIVPSDYFEDDWICPGSDEYDFTNAAIGESAATSLSSATKAVTTQMAVSDGSTAHSVEPIVPSDYFEDDWICPWSDEYDSTNVAIGESAATSLSSATTAVTTQMAVSDGSTGHSVEPIAPSDYFEDDWICPWSDEYDSTNAAIGDSAATSLSSATTTSTTQITVSDGSTANSVGYTAPSQYVDVGWKFPFSNEYDFSNTVIGEAPAASSAVTAAVATATDFSSGSSVSTIEPAAPFKDSSGPLSAVERQWSSLGTRPSHIGTFPPSGISGAGYGSSDDVERILSSGFGAEREVNSLVFPTGISAVPSSRLSKLASYSSPISEILWSPSGLMSPAANQRIASLTTSLVSEVSRNKFNALIFSGSLSSLVSQISRSTTLSQSQILIEASLELISVLLNMLSGAQLGVVSTTSLPGTISAISQSVVNALNPKVEYRIQNNV